MRSHSDGAKRDRECVRVFCAKSEAVREGSFDKRNRKERTPQTNLVRILGILAMITPFSTDHVSVVRQW